MANNNLKWVSAVYSMGALLVVAGHSLPFGEAYKTIPEFVLSFRSFIYIFHMPLFFFISGFLLSYTKTPLRKGYGPYIKAKAVKLLTPYIALSAVAIIPKYLVSSYINGNVSLDFMSIVRTIFVPRENVWGHFWFIPVLFLLFVILGGLCGQKRRWLLVIAIVLSVFIYFVPLKLGVFGISDLCKHALFFIAGMFCFEIFDKFKEILFDNKLRSYIIALITAGIITAVLYNIMIRQTGIVNSLFRLITTFIMILLLIILGLIYEKGKLTFLDSINKHTFTIFLLSWPFQAVVEIVLNKILRLPWYVSSIGMLIIGICGPLIVAWLYKFGNLKNRFIEVCLGLEAS